MTHNNENYKLFDTVLYCTILYKLTNDSTFCWWDSVEFVNQPTNQKHKNSNPGNNKIQRLITQPK